MVSRCRRGFGFAYAPLGLLESARIYEKLGRRDEAIRDYERFVELWKDCDPELRPQRAEAEARLEALRNPG